MARKLGSVVYWNDLSGEGAGGWGKVIEVTPQGSYLLKMTTGKNEGGYAYAEEDEIGVKDEREIMKLRQDRCYARAAEAKMPFRVDRDGFIWYAGQPVSFGREEDYAKRLEADGYTRVHASDGAYWFVPAKGLHGSVA